VSSAGGTATIGFATVGDGADESATPGVSNDTGLSGRGIIDTARNARAKPAGTAIQPAHPAAGIMRRTNCWSRDLGRGSAGGGGASPCQSHKPASLISVLTNAAEGDIGGVPLTIGALLYAWSISSSVSACMAHIPLLVATPIYRVHSVRHPGTGSGRIGCNRPTSSAMAIPTRLFSGGAHRRPKHHGFEVRDDEVSYLWPTASGPGSGSCSPWAMRPSRHSQAHEVWYRSRGGLALADKHVR
jgi:hypothetical protein